jgi:uncharacterized protein YdbL (DUF1318 family)
MKRKRSLTPWLAAGWLAAAVPSGCITINVYFPEKALQEAAEQIVDEVRPATPAETSQSAGEEGNAGVEAAAPSKERTAGRRLAASGAGAGARWACLLGSSVVSGVALAAEGTPGEEKDAESGKDDDEEEKRLEEEKRKIGIKIKTDTPRIKAIKKTLKKRYPKLLPFYVKGAVGEANSGYLVSRELKGLTRKEIRDLKLLLEAEKKDRQELYSEIARQNSIDKSLVPRIAKLFSSEWQKKCKTGWWIQDKKGKWIKKPPPKKPPKKGEKEEPPPKPEDAS